MTSENNQKLRVAQEGIKPYARLLTMLGDQLIKDERIALIELIKNAYDADATWVKISFENFKSDNGRYIISKDSKIIIEDDGVGMTLDTIQKAWMRPATPHKYTYGEKGKTKSNRTIQGEKGIGRFATLKLGRAIKITTRSAESSNEEYEIDYDLSHYDDNFLSENGEKKEIFLSDIHVDIYKNEEHTIRQGEIVVGHHIFERKKHGTRIEISNLRGSWSENKIFVVYDNVFKLQSIFTKLFKENYNEPDEFTVGIELNGEKLKVDEGYIETLANTIENNNVFMIEGKFSGNKFVYEQKYNDIVTNKELDFSSEELRALYVYKKAFAYEEKANDGTNKKTTNYRNPECGPFAFKFYIFDFQAKANKYALDKDQKNIIKKHRVYLYRDGIRVYPYGDPEDDWLNIDVLRGTQSAGQFFSNDQIIGYIEIGHDSNPKLIDKTNREGLIEEGNATSDFIGLIQTLLSYIRTKDYSKYQLNNSSKKPIEIYTQEQIEKSFKELKDAFEGGKPSYELLCKIENDYKLEKKYLVQRAEKTEELAGVGLSVETASHDILSFMSKAVISVDGLMADVNNNVIAGDDIFNELSKIRGLLTFVEAQLKDIQLLFRSAKRRRALLNIEDMVKKVERIYKRILERERIKLSIDTAYASSPLIAKTTEAVILQLLINLFDNAIYWLALSNSSSKEILITLDGNHGEMIFSDNGPGIRKEDEPYIFEPFYSGRGEEGKGLGLYIAKQLLERHDYSIELADIQRYKKLSGANFVISFTAKEL